MVQVRFEDIISLGDVIGCVSPPNKKNHLPVKSGLADLSTRGVPVRP